MSILRDLEPQNAKIHYSSAGASKSNQIALALAVLLLLGGTIGLFRNSQFEQIQTAVAPPETPVGIDPGPQRGSPASTPTPGAESALIRENRPAQNNREPNKSHDENVLQAMQTEPGKTQGEHLLSGNTSPELKKPSMDIPEQYRKTRNNANARKLPKNATRHASNNGRQLAEGYKKPMERDIDIITAIVK